MKPSHNIKHHISRLFAVLGAALIISGLFLSGFVQNALATPEPKVTICHAAGLDGTTKYVTLTLSSNAVYGQAGHFSEPGTPNAGHEDDYEGPCQNDDPYIEICYMGETLEVKESELVNYENYSTGACDTPETVTICYEGETLEVDESDLENYSGYFEGQCPVPDLVTICYLGQSLQVDRSELGNYPGYNLDSCPIPQKVKICYKGISMNVLVEDLDKYPGYNLEKCDVPEDDPEDDPEDEVEKEEVEPLAVPEVTTTGLLIPVTGGDLNRNLFGIKFGFSLVGFGLVLSGLGFAYKGFKKQQ